MSTKDSIHQPVDDTARALARRLLRTARFGALAVLEPGIDLMNSDRIERLEFDAPLADPAQLRKVLVELAARARATQPAGE